MCGIAGIFTPRGVPPASVDSTRMLALLRHRGPDAEAQWTSRDGSYRALFRRLAIIDIEGGDQPLVGPADERVLVGNGEIYNYLDLRARWPAFPYRSQGDMESALAAAYALGDGFADVLNGMFALALYEPGRHRLVLVRDRLGIKPLYWARGSQGALVFASEIKPILASGLVRGEVDEEAASAYLAHGYVPAPATLFRGIRKLPPAHRLSVDADGRETLERYWFPAADAAPPRDAEGTQTLLLALLRDSVRLQLRSDVPVGALLSGGLDSGLMVALAAEQSSRPLKTFTARFQGGAIDETPLARQVVERYGTEHQVLDVTEEDIASRIVELAWYTEEPLADPSLLPNFLIEQALSRDIRVALNGTGGDELFAGYPRYFQRRDERFYASLPRPVRAGLIEPIVAAVNPHLAWKLARGAAFARDRGAYLHGHSAYFPPPLRAVIESRLNDSPAAQRAHIVDFLSRRNGCVDTAALYADLATYLPEDLLLLLDRSSMAVSVEGRVPYLDHRLVEAALSVPGAIRTPGGAPKGLQRALARSFLPAEVLTAPKQGFASPVARWLERPFKTAVERLLTSRTALARGWWTRAGVERLSRDPHRHGHRLYALVMLELAVRLLVESPLESTAPRSSLDAFVD